MIKTFLIVVILIVALCAAFYFIPTDLHSKTLSTLGLAPPEEPDALKQAIGDTTLPQDPAKRREALLQALKKKVTDMQHYSSAAELPAPADQAATLAASPVQTKAIRELAQSSQTIITALEQSNIDSGLRTQITQRILDTVFPASKSTTSPEACSTPAQK